MSTGPKATDNLQLLKELMLGEEQQELADLKERLKAYEAGSIERISRDLAAAVRLRSELGEQSFDELVDAIQAGTESAIQRSVTRDKSKLSKALFPIMGPAIRSYVVELFRSMAENLNETIRNTTSLERIRWRVQAQLAGKPFSEYLMLKTANYRVEEVYLMGRESGMLLQHIALDPEDDDDDADLVSGMFTAIRSFVRDSFSDSADEEQPEELKRFTLNERQVLIEDGPVMVLAAVVRGTPPPLVTDRMKSIIEELHLEFQSRVEAFSGDTEELDGTRPVLEKALLENKAEASSKKGGGMWRFWLFLGLVGIGIATWIYFSNREQKQWDGFQARLEAEPGIEVMAVEEKWGSRSVIGLRDPMARKPAELVKEHGIDSEKVRFELREFMSLHPDFVTRREEESRDALMSNVTRGIESAKRVSDANAGNLVEATSGKLTRAMDDLLASTKEEFDRKLADLDNRHRQSSESLTRELLLSRYGHLDEVNFEFTDQGLTVSGRAPEPHFSELLAQLKKIESIGEVDAGGLKNLTVEVVDDLLKKIGDTPVAWESGTLTAEDQVMVEKLAGLVHELDLESPKLGRSYRFAVVAHPLIGTYREGNRKIEQSRADQVRQRLIEAGIRADRLKAEIDENLAKAGEGVSVAPELIPDP